MEPANTRVGEKLKLRSQLSLMQVEIIDCANSHEALVRREGASAIHEGAAGRAEGVGHFGSRGRRLVLAPARQVVLTADEPDVGVVDGEVGGEHGSGDLATVEAVADKGVDQTRGLSRLYLNSNVSMYNSLFKTVEPTKTICTAPQKQVAVASVSDDQPSRATPERGRF